jgi:hypothetical protein
MEKLEFKRFVHNLWTTVAIITCDLRRRITHFFITFAVASNYMHIRFLIM